MAAEWYYTTNKRQMGPVNWQELQQLASNGLVQPSDLVWTEGMSEWVRAATQDGLFATAVADKPSKKSAATTDDKPRRRRTRRDDDDDDDEVDDDDDRPRRRQKAKSAGMSSGMKIGLILAGAVLLLGVLGCGGVFLFMSIFGSNRRPPVGPQTYHVNNLRARAVNDRDVFLQAGKMTSVTVISNVTIPGTDVDLHVKFNGQMVAFDEALVANCQVQFVPANSGMYRLQVRNLGPGSANCTVTYRQ